MGLRTISHLSIMLHHRRRFAECTPSVNFQKCEHTEDHEGALALSERVLEAARLAGIPLVPIADGWVCADPQKSLIHWHIETCRYFNKANLPLQL